MAWTSPMTWVANTALTAAQLNTHLRDNLMEMSVAKATTAGQFFVSAGRNQLATRTPQLAVVNTSETTTSTDWVSLTTPGPAVTVTTGTKAWIWISCESESTGSGASRTCSYDIQGATTRDPQDNTAIRQDGQGAASNGIGWGQADLVTTLVPGENIFSMKYKSGGGGPTTTFRNRRMVVWPL